MYYPELEDMEHAEWEGGTREELQAEIERLKALQEEYENDEQEERAHGHKHVYRRSEDVADEIEQLEDLLNTEEE